MICILSSAERSLTFRHGAGADEGRHAAGRGDGLVAGVDLDLVAGEVSQVGDDGGLLGVDSDHGLRAFEGFLVLIGEAGAPGGAGGGGEEGERCVGDPHHRAPLPGASAGAGDG